ncbi:hypothetical protein CFN78_01225 [Amycolatopsis antarctica]|uniref:WXG100 family type VII secretion target n=1 Tax=Amycolatopsis antarctica TaxID=1854586 RepID=A0A263DBU4_9PSEU|nr:hypothetical protein [Amycolatopsis antarctica]OZM74865.1 hypothetical protein CFN78_01225 [Amycolatopsis antarctica]
MSDPLGDIALKQEDGTGKKVVNAIPIVGSAVKVYDAGTSQAIKEGSTATGLSGVMSETTNLIQSCAETAMSIATDPIGWLVGQGLNFLLAVCDPLQDAIHFVSGDGPALAAAAESFNNIGRGMEQFAAQFNEQAQNSLAQWEGGAAEAAAGRLAEFSGGITGTADQAGDIATLLQACSMLMTVIEEFIKALLTELITWLIMIWVPALAAAIPTAGASTAAAGAATPAKAAGTATKATKQVSKLQKVLDQIKELIDQFKVIFGKTKDIIAKMGTNGQALPGMAGRINDGFGSRMAGVVTDQAKSQIGIGTDPAVGPPVMPGKPMGHLENARKAGEYAATGDGQSVDETKDKLDF